VPRDFTARITAERSGVGLVCLNLFTPNRSFLGLLRDFAAASDNCPTNRIFTAVRDLEVDEIYLVIAATEASMKRQ
jgi:hypothetical protein